MLPLWFDNLEVSISNVGIPVLSSACWILKKRLTTSLFLYGDHIIHFSELLRSFAGGKLSASGLVDKDRMIWKAFAGFMEACG